MEEGTCRKRYLQGPVQDGLLGHLIGDIDFFANDFLTKHWGALNKKDGSGEFCESCPANNSNYPWNYQPLVKGCSLQALMLQT